MLPPNSDWKPAPILPSTLRERTVIPRTRPRYWVTRCPSISLVVVTSMRDAPLCGMIGAANPGRGYFLDSAGAMTRRRLPLVDAPPLRVRSAAAAHEIAKQAGGRSPRRQDIVESRRWMPVSAVLETRHGRL